MRLVALAILAILLAGGAAAQGPVRPVPVPGDKPVFEGTPSLNIGIAAEDGSYLTRPFFVVGADNAVNVTVYNYASAWLNDTVIVKRSNAASLEETIIDRVPVSVPPGEMRYVEAAFHPDETGVHLVRAQFEDTTSIDGGPLAASLEAFAAPAITVRVVDPPPVGGSEEGYISGSGGFGGGLRIRARPDDILTFRVEAKNLRDVEAGGFELILRTFDGETVGSVDVPGLDGRGTETIEFPEWSPGADPRYAGCRGCTFGFEIVARYRAAGGTAEVGVASYRLENGAVTALVPASGFVELQESLVGDVLIPKEMRLGVPARIKANVTNFGTDVVRAGSFRIVINTPNNLNYGVQGPEVREFTVRGLAPGESQAFAFEFTPRVTGSWSVYSVVRDKSSSSGGGGIGFLVEGPVTLSSASSGVLLGRIGEPIEVDVRVHSSAPVENAELRVVAQSPQGFGTDTTQASGEITVGIAQRIVRSDPVNVPLGTLRAGDAIDATFTLISSGSGVYQVTPFVVAGGFAYTSTPSQGGPGFPGRPVDGPFYGGPAFVQLAIQTRPVNVSWALFPLTLVVAFTVGAWTLRTRFVR